MIRFAVACLAVGVSTLVSAQSAQVRVGVIAPFSSKDSGEIAQSIRGSARVFAEEVNRIGGILGAKVELVERDDQGKPDVGARIAKDLIEKDKVSVIVGFADSAVVAKVIPLVQNAHVPMIVTGATGGDFTQTGTAGGAPNFVFRVVGGERLQARAMIKDVVDRRGINALSIIHDKSASSLAMRDLVLAELNERGVRARAVESFDAGEQDVGRQLGKARDAGAKAVLVIGGPLESAMVVRSQAKLKWNVPAVGTASMTQQSFLDTAGPAAEGVRAATTFIEDSRRGPKRDFAMAYRKLNNVADIPAPTAAAQTYDALRLFYLAAFESGSLSGDSVQHTLEGLDIQPRSTVVTRYSRPFIHDDHEAVCDNMVVMAEIHGQKLSYAYPDDEAVTVARTHR